MVGLNFFYWALLLNMDFNCVAADVRAARSFLDGKFKKK